MHGVLRRRGNNADASHVDVRMIAVVTLAAFFLALGLPALLRAVDLNGDNLDDTWEAQYGFSTNAYAATNLVGWWQLNGTNSTDNATDRSGHGINGTLSGFPTTAYGLGLFSNALYFTTNAVVNFPTTNIALNVTNQFTFSSWFQSTNSVSQPATITTWSDAATNGWSVGVSTNGVANFTFFAGASKQIVSGGTNAAYLYDGNWHQVAATYATNQIAKVYVDGVAEATNTVTSWSPGAVSSFTFGAPNTNTVNNPYGLDEVRLYNRALGASEIPLLPVTYSDLSETGLTVFDDFLEGLNPLSTTSIVTSGFASSGLTAYYGTNTPSLTKTGGDGQSISASTFASNPLVVQVKNGSGTPLVNAPITFSIPLTSDGGLSLTSGGTTTTSLSLTTDSSGYATVYYEAGAEALLNSTIYATAVSTAGSAVATFTEYCGVQSGLTMWLRADEGVTQTSGNVSVWADQTVNGNNASQSSGGSQPSVVANSLNGEPVINFSGSTYLATSAAVTSGQTYTTFVVSSPDNNVADPFYNGPLYNGLFGVNGWGFVRDTSTLALLYGGQAFVEFGSYSSVPSHQIYCATRTSSPVTTVYANGVQSGSTSAVAMNNPSGTTMIGAVSLTYGLYFTGDVAEVLVYNRALTDTEREQVDGYLADKYGLYDTNATWPSSYSSDVQAEITQHQWDKAQADNYLTLQSNTSGVVTAGLTLWLKADAGTTVDGSGNVSEWDDQTGNYNVMQATSGDRPTFVSSDFNSQPGLRFNGSQWLRSEIQQTGLNADMTVITVGVTTTPTTQTYSVDLGQGTSSYQNRALGYYNGNELFDTGTAYSSGASSPGPGPFTMEAVTLDSSVTNVAFYQNGSATGTGTLSGVQNLSPGVTIGAANTGACGWQGDIAEVLVYDHKLTSSDLQQVSTYLANKYGLTYYGFVAPTSSPTTGTNYTGSVSVTLSGGISLTSIHYTLDGTEPTIHSAMYTGAITLTGSALVQAAVFVNGQVASPLLSAQYYVNDSSHTGLPTAPSSLTTSIVSGTEIDLGWSLSGEANYSGIAVYRSSDGGTTYQLVDVLDPSATSYQDTNAVAGSSYKYKVGTLNTSGESDTSTSSSVTATAATTMTITVTSPSGATPLP